MDRFFSRLVNILAATCLLLGLSACQMMAADLPKGIMLDDSFSEAQEEAFLKAINDWNLVGQEYLGYDIIIYEGRYSDRDGFSPMEDIDDGNNVVYNVDERDKWYDYLYSIYIEGKYGEGASVAGYGLDEDVLMFDFVISEVADNTADDLAEDNGIEYSDDEIEDMYLHYLQHVMVHELGHWISLQHIHSMNSNGHQPVMYPSGAAKDILEWQPPFLTKLDIQAFCLIYDCIKQP